MCRTLMRVRGRGAVWVFVQRRNRRRLAQAARRMRARGWAWDRIASGLRVPRARVEQLVAADRLWGEMLAGRGL